MGSKMEKRKFLDLLEKQRKGMTTALEDQIISEVYDGLQEDRIKLEMDVEEEAIIRKRIKRNIDNNIETGVEKKQIPSHYIFKIAASMALIAIASYLLIVPTYTGDPVEIMSRETDSRHKASIILSDGTRVHLNINSSIVFPEKFADGSRVVEIEGEAFFEVKEDSQRPFIVKSKAISTKVLGTSFNVNAYDERDIEVAVKTGHVEVSSSGERPGNVVLNPDQKAKFIVDSGELTVEKVDMDKYLDWRNRTLVFDMDSLSEIISRISKAFNVQISLKG